MRKGPTGLPDIITRWTSLSRGEIYVVGGKVVNIATQYPMRAKMMVNEDDLSRLERDARIDSDGHHCSW